MRILIVSYLFPPFNCIAAVRVGKTAKYLQRLGNQVRVLTCGEQLLPKGLDVEIDEEKIFYSGWLNVNRPVEIFLGGRQQVAAQGYTIEPSSWGPLVQRLGMFYKNLVNFPDGQIGWLPYALSAGKKMVEDFRPDLLFASSYPVTSLLVGRRLAEKFGIPWVAEFRDLWVDNHNRDLPKWRNRLEEGMERRVLASAAGVVTVSDPLADTLRRKAGNKPILVVTNGFDPEDYPAQPVAPRDLGKLSIVYTGRVYEGKQDTVPLLKALKLLDDTVRKKIRVRFFGRYLHTVRQLISEYRVEDVVDVHDPVSYKESLRLQMEADILLFLIWQDPLQKGVYSGKLFEYLGARRPILAIGSSDDVAAGLIRERKCGSVLFEPQEIAGLLNEWVTQKTGSGCIPPLVGGAGNGFSREEQTAKLAAFLRKRLGSL